MIKWGHRHNPLENYAVEDELFRDLDRAYLSGRSKEEKKDLETLLEGFVGRWRSSK